MIEPSRFTFTEGVGDQGGGGVVTMHGHTRRRPPHVDLEHVLIVIGAIGVLVAVAVALWGPA
jgi:hypothetical protein